MKNHEENLDYSEDDRWHADFELKKMDLNLKRQEIEIKLRDQERSRWTNPLVVAILAGAIAGIFNAGVAYWNFQKNLQSTERSAFNAQLIEKNKAEASRILSAIDVPPDQASANLRFLLETKLIRDQQTVQGLTEYLDRQPISERPASTAPYLAGIDSTKRVETIPSTPTGNTIFNEDENCGPVIWLKPTLALSILTCKEMSASNLSSGGVQILAPFREKPMIGYFIFEYKPVDIVEIERIRIQEGSEIFELATMRSNVRGAVKNLDLSINAPVANDSLELSTVSGDDSYSRYPISVSLGCTVFDVKSITFQVKCDKPILEELALAPLVDESGRAVGLLIKNGEAIRSDVICHAVRSFVERMKPFCI